MEKGGKGRVFSTPRSLCEVDSDASKGPSEARRDRVANSECRKSGICEEASYHPKFVGEEGPKTRFGRSPNLVDSKAKLPKPTKPGPVLETSKNRREHQ
ncbi:hypothetical protein VNO77_19570 [Canavalia gladiata]|uniref:Uncharacterized protein n=1 Tax=Canavalia gladiata TaxID=3824 RepID=A0AAN9LNM4_CANGL